MSLRTFQRQDLATTRQYIVDMIDGLCAKYHTDAWTDRSTKDLGVAFIEIAARVGDLLNFYIDKQAKDTYLSSVVQRKNMKRILNLVNYKLHGPEPARTTLLFSANDSVNFEVVIPKYFQVAYTDPSGAMMFYATAEDAVILPTYSEVQVDAVQGQVHTVNMTVQDLGRFRTTTITDHNVANNSVIITVDGEEYKQVPDVRIEEDDSKKFSLYENLDDQLVIEFGYSWRDALPGNPKTPVVIKYLTTEGSRGAISAGRITTIVDQLNVNGASALGGLLVQNLYDATGGADRETMEEARVKAPHITQSRQLMATLNDYRYFAENIPGVYKAQAVDWNVGSGQFVKSPYQVDIYVVPSDQYTYIPCLAQRNHIHKVLEPSLWSAITLNIVPPVVHNIDLIVKVYTTIPENQYSSLRYEIQSNYIEFFNKFNRSFGETFTIGQLESVAKQSTRVTTAEMLAPSHEITLTEVEFPKLNNVDVEIVSPYD